MARHLISIHDLTAAEVAGLCRVAADVKANPGKYARHLAQKSLGMIFEKSSTRTRVSFEVGMDVAVASPKGYEVKPYYLELARQDAAAAGTQVLATNDPAEAVAGAACVYTDVWASMGQEAEAQERLQAFHGFTVDAALMKHARPDAVFLHCLPAHRGEEVAAKVADGAQSRIFDEAENRLHAQKAVMLWLMGGVGI